MINIIKPLSLFIGVYIVVVSLFGFAYDTSESTIDSNNLKNEAYNEMISTALDDVQPVDTSTVIIDNIYTQMVLEQFIADAEKNGLKEDEVIEHIKALDAIIVDDLNPYGLLGVTVYRQEPLSPTGVIGMIILNQELLANPDLYMFTLYHELGHWFGLPHCGCEDAIMMDGYDQEPVQEVFNNWDKEVKELMKDIKKGWNRKGDHYAFPSFEVEETKNKKRGKNKLYYHKFGENIVCEHHHTN